MAKLAVYFSFLERMLQLLSIEYRVFIKISAHERRQNNGLHWHLNIRQDTRCDSSAPCQSSYPEAKAVTRRSINADMS